MGRRRKPDNFDQLRELLTLMPSWAGPVLAILVFLTIRFLLPLIFTASERPSSPGYFLRGLAPTLSWVFGGLVLLAWVLAEVAKFSNRRLFDRNRDGDSIRQLTWHAFERYMTEYFRRQGYLSEHVGAPGGDGGVDILLQRHGERVFVQCKQWKAYKVGVTSVRELLGVVSSEGADRGIIVTSGEFTSEALEFAMRNPSLELIDGQKLEALVGESRQSPEARAPTSPAPPTNANATPVCPQCGTRMVLRLAKRGSGAGQQFWGCPGYPKCRGTRPLSV